MRRTRRAPLWAALASALAASTVGEPFARANDGATVTAPATAAEADPTEDGLTGAQTAGVVLLGVGVGAFAVGSTLLVVEASAESNTDPSLGIGGIGSTVDATDKSPAAIAGGVLLGMSVACSIVGVVLFASEGDGGDETAASLAPAPRVRAAVGPSGASVSGTF